MAQTPDPRQLTGVKSLSSCHGAATVEKLAYSLGEEGVCVKELGPWCTPAFPEQEFEAVDQEVRAT